MCYFAFENYLSMKKIFILAGFFIFLVSFISCNDGEVIVKNFNFDNVPLKTCGEIGNYVFYKENTESLESLSLQLGIEDSIYNEPGLKIYPLSTNSFVNYRRYDGPLGDRYFCSSVPPATPKVLEEYKAVSGSAEIIITFEYIDDSPEPRPAATSGANRPLQQSLHKHIQIILKDLVLVKENEQIIVETLDMGSIENIEVIEL